MPIIEIHSADDERIAAYRNIRERDLVGRQGCFIAEGKVVLGVLLASRGYAADSVLVLKRRVDAVAQLAGLQPDIPVYVVEQDVMAEVAGFDIHRGVLAVGRRNHVPTLRDTIAGLTDSAVVVVCVGISNHDNVGSIFRNAAAFGAAAVLLDGTCCDPLYRKALRVSVGGVLKVPFARFDDFGEVHRSLADAGFRQFALSPRGGIDVGDIRPGGRTALYLGAEGEGLPEGILEAVESVRIPISSDFDSLNVAAASAIALHRLARL